MTLTDYVCPFKILRRFWHHATNVEDDCQHLFDYKVRLPAFSFKSLRYNEKKRWDEMALHVAYFWHTNIHYPFLNAHLFIHWLISNFNFRAIRSICIPPKPPSYTSYLLEKWSLVELLGGFGDDRFKYFNVISYHTFICNGHMQARADIWEIRVFDMRAGSRISWPSVGTDHGPDHIPFSSSSNHRLNYLWSLH